MAAEMAEQPDVLGRLLDRRRSTVRGLRRALPTRPVGVALVARGSSDNAAVYGRYLLGMATGRPVALAAPSLVTLYGVDPRVDGWLAVAVSQSGRTPEIVDVARRMTAGGAHVVAVTNDDTSPLATVSHSVIHLDAGRERAVPATKTFTAQLLCMALIADAVGGVPWDTDDWDRVPHAVADVLDDTTAVDRAAAGLDDAPGLLVTARGLLLATALEAALKLKECAGLIAQGYSMADLRHGPIAIVERDFPVIVLSSRGATASDAADLVDELRDRGARLIEIGQRDAADIGVPPVAEGLMPVVSAVRGQQLALAAARRRGLDPDSPEGLSKITPTR